MAEREHEELHWMNPRLTMPAYTYADAGRYAATSPQNVRNWFQGQEGPGHKMVAVFDRVPRHGLSYIQLVEVGFVASMRRRGLKLEEMRKAYAYVREELKSSYPFAEQRFLTDGMELFIEAYGQLIVPSRNGQIVMRDAIKSAADRLEYVDQMAARWYPRGREKPIVIDADVAFGRPTISGTGIPTKSLSGSFAAGDTVESLAHDFRLSREQVEEAVRFELPKLAA